jgi:hypothetical protein
MTVFQPDIMTKGTRIPSVLQQISTLLLLVACCWDLQRSYADEQPAYGVIGNDHYWVQAWSLGSDHQQPPLH